MQALARWSFLHRRAVVVIWVLSFLTLMGAATLAGSHYEDNLSLPGTASDTAVSLLHKDAPRAGDVDEVVFTVKSGSVTEAATKQRIQSALAAITTLPHVSSVASPFTSIGGKQISGDGQIAFALVTFDKPGRLVPAVATKRIIATAKSAATVDVRVELGRLAVSRVLGP